MAMAAMAGAGRSVVGGGAGTRRAGGLQTWDCPSMRLLPGMHSCQRLLRWPSSNPNLGKADLPPPMGNNVKIIWILGIYPKE